MKVFISWSGEPSQTFAKTLADWLPRVIQSIEPFLSSNDIRSGQRWFSEIGKQLQDSKFGILCLTPNNKEAPWMLFEAGAISKIVDESRVVPLLIGLDKSQITAPLSQFQARSVSKDEMLKLIQDMNRLLASPVDSDHLKDAFDAFWPRLETGILNARKEVAAPSAQPKRRQPEEMTEEILDTVRSMGNSLEHVKALIISSQITIQNEIVRRAFTFTPSQGLVTGAMHSIPFTGTRVDLGLAPNPSLTIPSSTIQASAPQVGLAVQSVPADDEKQSK